MTTMTTKTCAHTNTITIATRPYTGGVSQDSNRAAHGNVCSVQECTECGARRLVNLNGGHSETGNWGPSAAEVAAEAARNYAAARRAAALIEPLRIGRGDVSLTLRVLSTGEIAIEGQHTEADLISAKSWLARCQPEWLAAARAVREMVLR